MKFMKKKNRKAFTLIELLAVITIMGILVLIAIPASNAIIKRTRKTVFVYNVKQLINSARTTTASDSVVLSENGLIEYTLEELGSTDPNLKGKIIGKKTNEKIEFFTIIFDQKNKFLLGDYSNQGLIYYEEKRIEVPHVQTIQNIDLRATQVSSILPSSNHSKTLYLVDDDDENVDIYTKNKEGKYEKDIMPLYYGGILELTSRNASQSQYYDSFYIIDQTATTVEILATKFEEIYDFDYELKNLTYTFHTDKFISIRPFTCADLYRIDFETEFQKTSSYDNACDYYLENNFYTTNLKSKLFIGADTRFNPRKTSIGSIEAQIIYKDKNTTAYQNDAKYEIKYTDTRLSPIAYSSYRVYNKYVIEVSKDSIKCYEDGDCYLNDDF